MFADLETANHLTDATGTDAFNHLISCDQDVHWSVFSGDLKPR